MSSFRVCRVMPSRVKNSGFKFGRDRKRVHVYASPRKTINFLPLTPLRRKNFVPCSCVYQFKSHRNSFDRAQWRELRWIFFNILFRDRPAVTAQLFSFFLLLLNIFVIKSSFMRLLDFFNAQGMILWLSLRNIFGGDRNPSWYSKIPLLSLHSIAEKIAF